jgi:iron-sulfur cluster repair protein YtfE (RIC family)
MDNNFSISAYFEKDHDLLDEIFQQYLNYKQTDLTRSDEQLLKFKSEVGRHLICEEEILYPLYEQKCGTEQDATNVMRQEHQKVRSFINMLETGKTLNDHEVKTFLIVIGQHCLKEECVIFPELDRVLTPVEKAVVFEKLQQVACRNPKTTEFEFESPIQKESSFPLILPGN